MHVTHGHVPVTSGGWKRDSLGGRRGKKMEHTWFPMGEVTLTVRKKLKFVLDILPSPQASQELQASGWVDGEKRNGTHHVRLWLHLPSSLSPNRCQQSFHIAYTHLLTYFPDQCLVPLILVTHTSLLSSVGLGGGTPTG